MEKELTDEEKKIAEKLHKDIKSEILSSIADESVGKVVKRIVKLSKEGLNEEEIIEVVKVDLKPIAAATCTDRLDRYCGGGSDL
jgi:DNA replication initiation complex subunit (GINS family)